MSDCRFFVAPDYHFKCFWLHKGYKKIGTYFSVKNDLFVKKNRPNDECILCLIKLIKNDETRYL